MNLPNYKEARKREKKDYKVVNYQIEEKFLHNFCGKTYFLKTYGCQMNEHDSENIMAMLESLGFKRTDNYMNADLALLNTCSIRENAHNKAFGMLGRLKHVKETIKKDLVIGICGCMAQEAGVVEDILKNYKFVNFVFGTHNINELPQIVFDATKKEEQIIEVYSKEGDLIEDMPVKRDKNHKAYVNIIYGCDKFCTYCIVPFTRGRERSRRKEDIIKEVADLVKDGYKEVTLLGQNVNAYGKDIYEDYGLGELLEDVSKTNIPRIRFMTSHPWDFSDSMIEKIAKYKNIMPHIHLPIQSGSSRILKKMGRRYTKEEYLELFNKIKKAIPNVSISTDIIVGFPGEEEEDFLETLNICEYCQFDNAFTFIFSKRENTPAAKLKDTISKEEKEERLQRLNEVVNHYFLENNKKLVGKTVEVLTEGASNKPGMYYGYTDTNKLINFTGEDVAVGDMIEVEVTSAKTWSLDGCAKSVTKSR